MDQSLSVEGQISPAHQPSSLSPVHHTPTGGELSPSHRQLSPSHQPSMGGRRLSPSTTQGDYPEEQLGAQSTESARPHPSSAAGGRPSQGGQSPSRGQPPQGSQSPLGAQPSQGGQSPSGGHPLPGSQSASRSHTYQNVERPSIPYKAPIPTVDSFTQDMARLNLGGPTPQEVHKHYMFTVEPLIVDTLKRGPLLNKGQVVFPLLPLPIVIYICYL